MHTSAKACNIAVSSIMGALALLGIASPACAQRASENAITSSDDAFGNNVGLETSGIYNENDTRGFSPLKAGNARLDGIYFDPVVSPSNRLKRSNTIRVGFAAIDYPFPAPTGIVDNRLSSAGNDLVVSPSLLFTQYGGTVKELDTQIPLVRDHVSMVMGAGHGDSHAVDGTSSQNWSFTAKPVFRFGGIEFSPWYSMANVREAYARPLTVVTGAAVPELPQREFFYGQHWAQNRNNSRNIGATLKVPVTDRLSLRAGLFRSALERLDNYTDIFTVSGATQLASHRVLSDPVQDTHSLSGEVQMALLLGDGPVHHRIIAGFRGRDRHTESGGSDVRSFGTLLLGEKLAQDRPDFAYSPVNVGKLRQTSFLIGYLGSIAGVGRINLGLQRADYHARFTDARSGIVTESQDRPWLYNASAEVQLTDHLSLFAGTQRGLEDSGAAPENAVNRNEQLPATRSTQFDGGLRWKFGLYRFQNQLVISLFQITKPYFSFDASSRFTQLGDVRHRGIEASLNSHFGTRLTVLGGVLVMKPEVSGPGRDAGVVGKRPAGTPSVFARLDFNYRTDILDNLTPGLTFRYTGSRGASSRPLAALGGEQLMLPAAPTIDLSLRKQFKMAGVPASFRVVLYNVFDDKSWKVVASNTLQPEERRRLFLTLAADF
jgi:iron complex outermembrane receptor protein